MRSEGLPGADLVEQGLRDIANKAETVESLLVTMAAPALGALGYSVPAVFDEPELRLYRLLSATHGDGAHSRYNALVRRVVSFQRAAACAK